MTRAFRTINRRETLLAIAGAVGAGVAFPAAAGIRPADRDAAGAPAAVPAAAPADDPVERALREDLDRLGSRAYSDEGIPVFLACVDVAAARAHRPAAPPLRLSKTVAAELRVNGQAWLRIHPEAPATDISKLIEVLAERDFRRGGKAGTP